MAKDFKTLADLIRFFENLDGREIRVKIKDRESGWSVSDIKDQLEKQILLER